MEKVNFSCSISECRTSELNEKSSDINQEFVSEDYDTSALSMDDIRREIEQLTDTKGSSNRTKGGSPGNHRPMISSSIIVLFCFRFR